MITYHVLQAAADLAKQLNAIDEFDVEYGTFHIATTIELKFDGEPTGYQLVNYDPEGWTLEALDVSEPEQWQVWLHTVLGDQQSSAVRGTFDSFDAAEAALCKQRVSEGNTSHHTDARYVKKIS